MNIDRESLKIGTGPKTKTITKDYSHVSNEELKKSYRTFESREQLRTIVWGYKKWFAAVPIGLGK